MKNILVKQSDHLKELEKLSKQDRLIQMAGIAINRKNDIDEDKHNEETNENLKKISKTLEDSLGERGKLTSNIIKLADHIKKTLVPTTPTEKSKKKQESSLTADQIRAITEEAGKRRTYRGVGERVEGVKENVKDFFTLRGFLDKTGVVKRGTGGLFSDMLDRREEKQKYIKARMETKGTTFGNEETFGKQFDEQQNIQRKMRKNESVIKGYEELGFKETQIKRSKAFKERSSLAEQLSNVDTRIRPLKEPEKAKESTAKGKPSPLVTKESTAKGKPSPLVTKESTAKGKAAATTTAKVINFVSKQEKTTPKELEPSIPKTTTKILSEKNTEFSDKAAREADISNLSEEEVENSRRMDEQTELLKTIAENTTIMAGGTKDKPKKEPEKGGGLFDGILSGVQGLLGGLVGSIFSSIGKSVLSAFKSLFNPGVLLRVITRFLAPAMLIGGIVNGIMDGWNTFIEGGSFSDVLIAGLGGVLEFLSFGLFDAETIKNVVSAVSGFVDDYIIQPIKNFMSFLGESFDTYIKQPIMGAFEYIGTLFTEYIVNPVKEFFAPIADFFKKIKEQVFGFLEDFGIPEIGFTIPVIDKKVSIGPFYPFRPEQGTNRVASDTSLTQSSSAAGESSNFNQNIVTSGKTSYANKDGTVRYGKDETNVLSQSEKVVNGKATYTSNIATFDPATGKASISGDVGDREISKRAFGKIKENAKSGGDASAVQDIIKEDDAYQKLGFLDRRKVDFGLAKATDLVSVEPKSSGSAVYGKSADNAGSSQKPAAAPVNTIVNSSTSVKNNTMQVTKMPTRNNDPSLTSYINSRYAQ